MNKKRILVIICVIVLFVICYLIINTKYDRLARYPYGTDKERLKIESKLTDKEIEYIVEYSIEPDSFMHYLDCYHFNIYHLDDYNKFRSLFPTFNINDSVTIVERLYLLGRNNDEYYTYLLKLGNDFAVEILKSYLW